MEGLDRKIAHEHQSESTHAISRVKAFWDDCDTLVSGLIESWPAPGVVKFVSFTRNHPADDTLSDRGF